MIRRIRRAATVGAILLLAMTLTVPALAANHDDSSSPWPGMQAQGEVVRGGFEQKKYLAELDQPLVSTGSFVIARDRGLMWNVEKPLSTQLVITREQLIERSDGRETARISAAKQPGLSVVAAVLLAVFQGDMERLRQFFEIESRHSDAGREVITLRPASPAVGEFVTRVRLEGRERIERLRIDQPGGDYSRIELHTQPQSADPEQGSLSADERAAFSR